MITTIEEATAHARGFMKNASFIAVLPDGHIYACESKDEVRNVLENNETVFLVKGDFIKEEKINKVKKIK